MNTKLRVPLWILTVIAAAGTVLATGNLLTLPGIASQVVQIMPEAEAAVQEAVAISRKKSLIGLAICVPMLLISLALIRQQRQPNHP